MYTNISNARSAASGEDERRSSLDRRLAILFWALLLILAGAIWLFPAEVVPSGTWLIGIGVILLALNGVRLVNGIPVRLVPTVIGVLALAAGVAELAGSHLPIVSLTLIAIGASIVMELFGTRESRARTARR